MINARPCCWLLPTHVSQANRVRTSALFTPYGSPWSSTSRLQILTSWNGITWSWRYNISAGYGQEIERAKSRRSSSTCQPHILHRRPSRVVSSSSFAGYSLNCLTATGHDLSHSLSLGLGRAVALARAPLSQHPVVLPLHLLANHVSTFPHVNPQLTIAHTLYSSQLQSVLVCEQPPGIVLNMT